MVPENRPLTDKERHWLITNLALLAVGLQVGGGHWVNADTGDPLPPSEPEDPTPYLAQIGRLRVVGKCGCNDPTCHTIMFRDYRTVNAIRTLVCGHTDDRRLAIIDVDDDSGELIGLEVI